MKKILTVALVMMTVLCGIAGFSACKAKTFGNGEWYVVTPPTCSEDGLERRELHDGSTESRVLPALGHDWKDWVSNSDGTHTRICRTNPGHKETEECSYLDAVIPATCEAGGYTDHVCTFCSYSYRDAETQKTEHEWSAYVSNGNGTHTRTCLLNPAHTETVNCDLNDEVVLPTCEDGGFTRHTCASCGYLSTDTPTEKLGHSYGEWHHVPGTDEHVRACENNPAHIDRAPCDIETVETPATCDTPKTVTRGCTECDNHTVETVGEALGHSYGDWQPTGTGKHVKICEHNSDHTIEAECEMVVTETVAASCTAPGRTVSECIDCHYSETVNEPALQHSYGTFHPSDTPGKHTHECQLCGAPEEKDCEYRDTIIPATCEAGGYTEHTCTGCGASSRINPTEPSEHDWGTPVPAPNGVHIYTCSHNPNHTKTETCVEDAGKVTEATCTAEGYTAYTCTLCHNVRKDRIVEPTGHQLGRWQQVAGESYHKNTCTECGTELHEDCVYGYITEDATCTAGGTTYKYCDTCGARSVESTSDALGHSYGNWIYTGSNGNHKHTHYCTRCPHDETAPCNMKSVSGIPTCTKPADVISACEDCLHSEDIGDVAALGHTWDNDGAYLPMPLQEGKHFRTCTVCNEQDVRTCSYTNTTTDPTCGKAGFIHHLCTVCNYSYDEENGAALQHDWHYTNLMAGKHSKLCLLCNTSQVDECLDESVIVEPTCFAQGYTQHTCSLCNHTYTDTPREKLEHDWNPWQSTGSGTHTRTCKNDRNGDHTEVENCDFTGAGTVVAPTCTEKGYTRHVCETCQATHDEEFVNALGHDWGAWTPLGNGKHSHTCNHVSENNPEHSEEKTCSYGESIVTPATCEADGKTVEICTLCNYEHLKSTENKLGHNYIVKTPSEDHRTHLLVCTHDATHTATENCEYDKTVVPATCDDQGYHIHTCTICAASYKDEFTDKLGHNWSETWTYNPETRKHSHVCLRDSSHTEEFVCSFDGGVVTEPKCGLNGFTTYTCETCKGSYTGNETAALEHRWSGYTYQFVFPVSTHFRTCELCGEEERESCSLSYETHAPTCTDSGYRTSVCRYCKHEMNDPIPTQRPLGHDWEGWKPADPVDGVHTHVKQCSRCGATESESRPLEVSSTPATCTTGGAGTEFCPVCLYSEATEGEAPLGHLWSDWQNYSDTEHYRYCTRGSCGEREIVAHSFTATVSNATCTAPETTAYYCEKCDTTRSEVTHEALGHDFSDWSFTEDTHTGTCIREGCRQTLTDSHDFTKSNLCPCGYDGLTYEEIPGTANARVKNDNRVGNAETIVVAATYQGKPVTEIGKFALNQSKAVEIVLPRSLQRIGEFAFEYSRNLQRIGFAAGEEPIALTHIEQYAFENCGKLTAVELPDGLLSIGRYAFSHCTSLASITIPAGVTEIGAMAFNDTAYYNEWRNHPEQNALYINGYLIVAQANVTAFTITDGTSTVCASAFENCTQLSSLTIPASVKRFDSNAFKGCTGLTQVEYLGTLKEWLAIRFENDYASPLWNDSVSIHIEGATGNITIGGEDGITAIPAGTFRNTALTGVTIKEGVTSIGASAFEGCGSLISIQIPDSVIYIGEDAFKNTGFYNTKQNWTNGILYIDHHLIAAKNEDITDGNVSLNDGTVTISPNAFAGCTNVTSITLPSTLEWVGENAFKGAGITSFKVKSGTLEFFATNTDGIGRVISLTDGRTSAQALCNYWCGSWRRWK